MATEIINGRGLAPSPCGVGGGDFDSGHASEEEGNEVMMDFFWVLWRGRCTGDFLKESAAAEGELKEIGWRKWGRKEVVDGERRAATSIIVL